MKTYFKTPVKRIVTALAVPVTFSLVACTAPSAQQPATPLASETSSMAEGGAKAAFVPSGQYSEAILAGGCFWCVESDFEKLPGVIEAISGYSGGTLDDPTYRDVTSGGSGHYEVAKIVFDSTKVSYEAILEHFWTHVDPTDAGGQFCDRGESYATAIFATPEQLDAAQKSKSDLQSSGRLKAPVVTPVFPAVTFYAAEEYHQDYYKKSSLKYKYYRNSCGRERRVAKVWGQ